MSAIIIAGNMLPALVLRSGLTVTAPVPPPVEYRHIFSYGQSLSVGVRALLLQTTAQMYDALSFVGGARPLDTLAAPAAYASLIPLVENAGGPNSLSVYGTDEVGETPLSGICNAINERDLGRTYQLIGTASGVGATPIAGLSQGTAPYDRMLEQVEAGKALADEAELAYSVVAIAWLQGESDILNAGYQALEEELANDLNTDIKAITGQAADVAFVTYQTRGLPSQLVGAAQLAAAINSPLIYMACPTYMATFRDDIPDTLHLDGPGSELVGAYIGRAIEQIAGGTDFKPLYPLSISYSGTHIDIACHVPVAPMVVDTVTFPADGFNGFSIFDAGDVAKSSTASIIGGTTIRLEIGEAVGDGWTVQYNNKLYALRGNIRDSAGLTDVYDPEGRNYPLHNWLVAFELTTISNGIAIVNNSGTDPVPSGDGYLVTKTAGTAAYDSDAVSATPMADDFLLRVKVTNAADSHIVGVNFDPLTTSTFAAFDRGILFGGGSLNAIVEGNVVGPLGTYTEDDYLFMPRVGDTVTLLKGVTDDIADATLVYTYPDYSDTAYFDSSLFTPGGSVHVRLTAS